MLLAQQYSLLNIDMRLSFVSFVISGLLVVQCCVSSFGVFNFLLAVSLFRLSPSGGPHHGLLERTTTRSGFPAGSGAGVDACDAWPNWVSLFLLYLGWGF